MSAKPIGKKLAVTIDGKPATVASLVAIADPRERMKGGQWIPKQSVIPVAFPDLEARVVALEKSVIWLQKAMANRK